MFPARWARACASARDAGFELVPAPHCTRIRDHSTAASAEQVVEDWLGLVEDQHVDAVIASTGGHTSNRLLDHVPWERLGSNRCPLVGYSDVSALLWAARSRGLPAVHGPMILSEFGHAGGVLDVGATSLVAALRGLPQVLETVPEVSTDDPRWDEEDHVPLRLRRPSSWRVLREGLSSAPVLMGCLPTVALLHGTPWMPETRGHFVVLEDPDLPPEQFAALLRQWRQTGRLAHVSGLGIGRRKGRFPPEAYDAALMDAVGDLDVPIIVDLDVGHTEPTYAVPLGARLEVDTAGRRLALGPWSVFTEGGG